MRSLLDALQAGRLIELPDNTKDRALQLLSNLIEAIPELPAGIDVAAGVVARERSANTALGKGWACPHARVPGEGELLCAAGWSPTGIDYGAPDGRPVRMLIMYLVPENQKNAYLKELSALAKALQGTAGFQDVETAADLTAVRNRLLDLVSAAIEAAVPDARARMIRLEVRQASVPPSAATILAGLSVQPLSIVAGPGLKPVVLAQHKEIIDALEARADLGEALAKQGSIDAAGWRVMVRGTTGYIAERALYDCLAIRSASVAAPGPATTTPLNAPPPVGVAKPPPRP